MKPDGVTMETTEPSHSDAAAESSSLPENVTEEAQCLPELASNNAAPVAAPKANGKPQAAEPKVKPKAVGNKTQCTVSAGVSRSSPRPGTASHRTVIDGKSSVTRPATMTTSKASVSAAGAVPKRPLGVAAASSTAKNQTRVPDKRPVGPARTTSGPAATVTNGTKPTAVNDASKKRPTTVNGARPKTTATTGRVVSSAAPKPTTSATAKPVGAATSKTTRPATGPSASRMASTITRPTSATAKPSTIATAKTAPSKAATAPSTGRTTATQPPKTAAAVKKDVSRPPSSAVAKKPTSATASPATKKHETTKVAAAVRLNAASKGSTATKGGDAKALQSKPQQPANPTATKKPVAAVRFPLTNKPPGRQTPPASPANKPANGSAPNAKRGTKPTRAVPPSTATKKIEVSKTTKRPAETQSTAPEVVAAPTEAETLAEAAVALPQESSIAASAPEEVSTNGSAQHTITEVEPREVTQNIEATLSSPQSPVATKVPQTCLEEQSENGIPFSTKQEQTLSSAKPTLPSVASPPDLPEENDAVKDKTLSIFTALLAAANAIPQTVPPANLDEEEDEEEREGSQLVSVSEMSGTTQPTEDSRPESGGTVGGSAWRAGGALLSELDSEEVSGSQQGASELSAPGVLEGTESMDDLGDGSLKGAIDMEGASAGSPDFEKVPDIPVIDFDEDDSDRVCDMDMGSERQDEPRRARHDNDLDEEDDDDDVEMASEGVTESGLESYGNADEDDFAEDERLDNLNRVAQPPPPPPVLPSAPAAQWDHPNPFADPWAEPIQGFQLAHVAGAVAANPLAEPWQEEPEMPALTPAQAWLEQGLEKQVVPYSSVEAELKNEEAGASMQTLGSAPVAVPGTSLSSTLSSETSTPEDVGGGKLPSQVTQAEVLSPQPDPDCQGLGIHLEQGEKEAEEEEAEPETLPADEILGGPATAPTSNPSSSTATEDEASDTEGEAQLEDSVETPAVDNINVESQTPAQRSLSTVEEGEEPEREEVEGGVSEDATPPSAASYGFDSVTTASNSNAQSTGESCIKSPGIFSLEELPEEGKQLHTEQCLAKQHYIECGKQEADPAEHVGEEALASEEALDPSLALNTAQQPEEIPDDIQPPYYSAICEKTEESFAGLTAVLHPHRRDHSAHPRTYYDLVKPLSAAVAPPKLTCADLPPRNPGQQALSPQLRRLEQHQRQLLELQQRREQQSRPLEEAEQERKKRVEEEERKKKEEAEEEIKRNEEERKKRAETTKKEEELKQRRDLELELQQQQQELKQRQQIMQWQQELQQSKGQTILLSPSSGLCTIYEALENSDEEAEDEQTHEQDATKDKGSKQAVHPRLCDGGERVRSDEDEHQRPTLIDSPPPASSNLSQEEDGSSFSPAESPERPPPLDLDWGKKVDIVQQLINQTLLLNGDGCSSLLLLPGGTGGKLSPLESSLWPSLVPPLTPPSATVTSVSSFSPEATGSSPQGEWTVVELETHH
ncbi:uncharacterized protein prr36a isoform 1-T2 [Odontesthes bonariensis]|uniref:uncharacterized protein prr36a n=1 Tax=Odontesthes bonariensis TaxID=219752 RepID=UPI003F582E44